jgi:hypothetical protein
MVPPELERGIIGRWIGFKYVLYNKDKAKDPVMKWYIDFLDSDENSIDSKGKPKNEWKHLYTWEDKDGFGDGDDCDGLSYQRCANHMGRASCNN